MNLDSLGLLDCLLDWLAFPVERRPDDGNFWSSRRLSLQFVVEELAPDGVKHKVDQTKHLLD